MSTDSPSQGEVSSLSAASENISASSSVPYQVVARRYRPQEFSQLIGQDQIARALSNAIETDRVGHAYLFTGARGVGKTSSARIFAKALNCVHGPTKNPCNQCEICQAISTGDDIDVLEIDGASNRGIDEIRQLRQNATIRPSRARYKIYIIDEVHMLTREAFNALLKTLEEPPEHVKFIFCTTEPNKIPITILSRCQRFDFAGIDSRSISGRLTQILQTEGVEAEQGVCETLARRANGSMRDAQSLLEQLLALAPKFIHLDDVHRMLGTVDDQKLFDLLNAIVKKEIATIFPTLDHAAEFGVDFGILMEQMLGIYRDLMVTASNCPPESLLYTSVGRYPEIRALAAQFGIRRILASMQILDQALQRMKYSTQNRILAELALVRLACLDQLQDVSQLLLLLKSGQFGPGAAQTVPNRGSVGLQNSASLQNPVGSSKFPGEIEKKKLIPSQPVSNTSSTAAPVASALSTPIISTVASDSVTQNLQHPTAQHPAAQDSVEREGNSVPASDPVTSGMFSSAVSAPSVQNISLKNTGSGMPGAISETSSDQTGGSGVTNGSTSDSDLSGTNTENSNRSDSGSSSSSSETSASSSSSASSEEGGFADVRLTLSAMNDKMAAELWQQILTLKNLGPVSLIGKIFSQIRFKAPNEITVLFPSSNLLGKTYSEMAMGSLKAEMERRLDGPVILHFEIDPAKPAEEKKAPVRKPEQRFRSKRELLRELDEHPMVLEAKRLFNADLTDIVFE